MPNYIPEITPFDLGGALRTRNALIQQQRGLDTQNAFAKALPMLQSDPQNALAQIGATGDVGKYAQAVNILGTLSDQKKKQVAEKADALGKAALTLQQYGDPIIRKAVANTMLPQLAQHGITQADLDNFNYSDQSLNGVIGQAQTVQGILAQKNADRTYEAGRSDHADTLKQQDRTYNLQRAEFGEKVKHNRAVEGAMSGPVDAATLDADPVIHSHVKNILSGNETMAQVPAAIRNKVSVALQGADSGSYSPLAGSRLTLASSRITAPFTNMAAYKLTADGLPYLQRIDAASKHPGSVSDQDLLDSLTKLNTGGNAVTDAQVKLITDGKSFSDSISTWGNKLQNGGVLSDNQRKQIRQIANDIFANYRKGYQPVYEQAASQLKAAGIPEQFWTIPDLNKLNAGQADILAEKPASAPAKSGKFEEGKVYQDAHGNKAKYVNGKWQPV